MRKAGDDGGGGGGGGGGGVTPLSPPALMHVANPPAPAGLRASPMVAAKARFSFKHRVCDA